MVSSVKFTNINKLHKAILSAQSKSTTCYQLNPAGAKGNTRTLPTLGEMLFPNQCINTAGKCYHTWLHNATHVHTPV